MPDNMRDGVAASRQDGQGMSGRALLDILLRSMRGGRPPAAMPPLQRLVRPSKEEFVYFRRASVPVRLDGVVDQWINRADWSLAGLRERFGDRIVSAVPTDGGRLICNTRTGMQFQAIRFGEYLEQLERGVSPGVYLATPADTWLPELTAHVQPPEYCADAPWRITRLWIGPAQTSAPLHRDVAENIYFQLAGRKRFFLYPPAATPWLYSHPLRSALPNYSRFDPEAPDYDTFSLSRDVQPLEVILEPGDAMYLPSRWWHQVRSLDVSVSFNFWWAYGGLSLAVRAAEFIKRARNLEVFGLENGRRAAGTFRVR
jgi:hypothetical protein